MAKLLNKTSTKNYNYKKHVHSTQNTSLPIGFARKMFLELAFIWLYILPLLILSIGCFTTLVL